MGLGLAIWSLYLIRKDIERGNIELTKGLSGVSDHNLERIVHYLDELEKQMADMNIAFYDLVSDLEGNFSVHDKELQLMSERVEKMEKQLKMLTSEVRIEHPVSGVQPAKVHSQKIKAYHQEVNKVPETPKQTERPLAKEGLESEVKAPMGETSQAKMLTLSPDEAHFMKQRILALRKEGKSLAQIAKALDVGLGELQLFIKLNTK